MWNVFLKKPGRLVHVWAHTLLVLVRDDATGVAARRPHRLIFEVLIKRPLIRVAELDNLLVIDGILMAIRPYAPHMKRQHLTVLIEGHSNDAFITPGRPEYLHYS